MRVISYNVNGIRAAIKKGFIDWLKTNPADIICVQETKATAEDVDESLFHEAGYPHCYWFSAEKKGYSGVAVFAKTKADKVIQGSGYKQSDAEGRVLQLQFGKILLINAYFPSGTTGGERQTYKYQWLDEHFALLKKLVKKQPEIILCGDYNIAHEEIDLHNPKGNNKTSGFLPEERAWMTTFFKSGWVDSFRHFHKDETGHYSWWTQRFPSVRLENKGWRLDYITVSEALKKKMKKATIYPDVKHSDHCPVFLEIGK